LAVQALKCLERRSCALRARLVAELRGGDEQPGGSRGLATKTFRTERSATLWTRYYDRGMPQYAPLTRCPRCGYLRESVPCPECGSYSPPIDPRPRERRRRILRKCALIVVVVGCAVSLVAMALSGGRGYRVAPGTVLVGLQHAGYPAAGSELLRRYHAGKLSADCFARMCDEFAVKPELDVPARYMTETDVHVEWTHARFNIPGGLAKNGWRVQIDGTRLLVDDEVVVERGARASSADRDFEGYGSGTGDFVRNPGEGEHTVALEEEYGLYPRSAEPNSNQQLPLWERKPIDASRALHHWKLRVERPLVIDPTARPTPILSDRAAREVCLQLHAPGEAGSFCDGNCFSIGYSRITVPIAGRVFARVHGRGEFVDLKSDFGVSANVRRGSWGGRVEQLGLSADWVGKIDLRIVPDEQVAAKHWCGSYFAAPIEILGVPVCPGGVPEDGTGEAVEIRVVEEKP
jgi:hypothetical protein